MLDVRRWALAAGRPLDAGVLGLILAAKTWYADEPLDRWSRIGVYQTLSSGVWNWCTVHSVPFPHDLPGVLWRYPKAPALLRRLDADGLPAPADAPPVPCVCKVPYRRRRAETESQADPRLAVPAVVPAPRDDIVLSPANGLL